MDSERRTFMAGMGTLAAAGMLAGCQALRDAGDGAADVDPAEDVDELPEEEMTFAHLAPPDIGNHNHRSAVTFQQYMENRSDGKFTVNISPAGELGSSTELVEQTMDDALEVAAGLAEGHIAPFYPDINVYADPYAFPSVQVAQHVMDDWFGDELRADMENELGIKVVGWHDNGGFRNYFTGGPRIETLDDFEGLTFRNMQIEAHQEITRALGATPEPIDWTELYEALDQGVVDGAEGSIPLFILGNFEEVQEFMILDGHVWSYIWIFASEGWFEDLHPTYQQMVREAGIWASVDARKVNAVARNRGAQYMEDNGVEIYEPPLDTVENFREATQEPVREIIRDEMDNPGKIEDMTQAIDDAVEGLGFDQY